MKTSSKSNQNKGGISIANLITLVGIALLGIFSYFGELFLCGGETGHSVLWAIVVSVVIGGLAIGATALKTADKNVKILRPVEYALLGFWFLSVLFLTGSFVQYFSVGQQRDELKRIALNDCQQLRELFESYETFETDAITITRMGLTTALTAPCDVNVEAFKRANSISSSSDVNDFCDIQQNQLLGDNYQNYKQPQVRKIDKWELVIKNWSVLQVPAIAKEMKSIAPTIAEALATHSATGHLLVIKNPGEGCVVDSDNQKFSYPDIQLFFPDQLCSPRKASAGAIVMVIIVAFMIIFNYVVAYRKKGAHFSRRKKNFDDGGQLLA